LECGRLRTGAFLEEDEVEEPHPSLNYPEKFEQGPGPNRGRLLQVVRVQPEAEGVRKPDRDVNACIRGALLQGKESMLTVIPLNY
jgi:hypothetical protein